MTRWYRRRWIRWVAGVVLAAGATGCTKPLYMTPETRQIAASVALPPHLENDPNVVATPDVANHKAPPTVSDSNREPRFMTLQEAIAIGLERGNRGSNFVQSSFGQGGGAPFSDDLVQFTGRGMAGDGSIRAFALDPAIAYADVEGALAKFDARLQAQASWQVRDQAVANIFNNFNNGDFAAFSWGLIKPLPTGGVISVTTEMNYSKLGAVPAGFAVINPSYTPSATVRFEQPLLRDSGIDINQLLPQHPGSTQQPFRQTGGRAEGILITRIRADQAKTEFEREANLLVYNVEAAYWTLYAAYTAKYAAEQALRQGYTTWEQLVELQRAGLQTKQGVAQARAQFEDFRNQHLIAHQQVLDTERRFRGLLGLPLEDGKRLVPADTPQLAPYKPDWQSALVEALNGRPELRLARKDLQAQQLNVMVQHNNLRPDLRFFANYNINGIGNRIDGPGPIPILDQQGRPSTQPGNAFSSLFDNRFNNHGIGFVFDVPLGNRDAHAALRAAQLNLARSHIVLKNQERVAEIALGGFYQQLDAFQKQIQIQQNRRIALGTQLEGQFERVKIGKDPLIQLLDAQRNFAGSIQAEADSVTRYQIAIAGFHFAKGSILQYNNISIADGPLPAAIQGRAADHFAAKAAAIKLRERPDLTQLPKEPGVPVALPELLTKEPLPAVADPLVPLPEEPPLPPKAKRAETAPISHPLAPVEMPGQTIEEPLVLPSSPVSNFRPK